MRKLRPRGRGTAWWLRGYAGATGAVLISLGAADLFSSPIPAPAGGLFQISVGTLFVYAGFGQRDPVVSRRFVGGMGVLLLVIAGAAACTRLLLGGEAGAFGSVQGTCLMVGLLSVLVARRAEPGVLLAAIREARVALGAAVGAVAARVRALSHRR